MGANVTFDPIDRLVIVTKTPVAGKVALDVGVDLYSDGKEDWRADATLNRLIFPFRTIGGDPIGGGVSVGAYFFLRNDLGWRIRPYEADHELTLVGNLFAESALLPIVVPTLGDFTVAIRLLTSSLTQQLETGVSGLTPDESQKLTEMHETTLQLLYQAKAWLTVDTPGNFDRYLTAIFKDGNPLDAGAAVTLAIEVLVVSNGATLFGPVAMTEVGGTNIFKYDSSVRTTSGQGYVIRLSGIVDGTPVEWLQPVGSPA